MNFALQSHHFKAKKFEKKLKFYAKVRYKAALGAQKTIKKQFLGSLLHLHVPLCYLRVFHNSHFFCINIPIDTWIFCKFSDLPKIAKVGEGTYGEVFIGGETVCKVAPFNGDSLVNGEIQKVCVGAYDDEMIRAWEDGD
ncbi:hypothetical protein LXL04_026179 [Taraxacum kok-saghyz]